MEWPPICRVIRSSDGVEWWGCWPAPRPGGGGASPTKLVGWATSSSALTGSTIKGIKAPAPGRVEIADPRCAGLSFRLAAAPLAFPLGVLLPGPAVGQGCALRRGFACPSLQVTKRCCVTPCHSELVGDGLNNEVRQIRGRNSRLLALRKYVSV